MKNILFATTATTALVIGGMASAQGISLFGDARLGLGYNIDNDGGANGEEDVRAVSRVRFGVNMTGETDSGITFGASIRADNASGGQGGSDGQQDGDVFVSGDWGTLTLGDTSGADENWVGDIPGNLSLTGLGDLHETPFISNGGNFGADSSNDFAGNPEARPTIRYDFDVAGFGLSLSSNRDLTDVGVGGGYTADFGGGSWGIALGYYDFNEFTIEVPETTAIFDGNGDPIVDENGDPVTVDATASEDLVDSGHQWSAGVNGSYEAFGFGVTYTNADSDGDSSFETLGVGGTFGWEAFTVGAYYHVILNADGLLEGYDDNSSYGLTGEYDLGGGAVVAGGVARTFGQDELFQDGNLINRDVDADTVADFGIRMSF